MPLKETPRKQKTPEKSRGVAFFKVFRQQATGSIVAPMKSPSVEMIPPESPVPPMIAHVDRPTKRCLGASFSFVLRFFPTDQPQNAVASSIGVPLAPIDSADAARS